MTIPESNKTYKCFDDGKIRESRMYEVTVKQVIPFDYIDGETLNLWKREVENCDWLYRKDTDFFIKAVNEDGDEEIFVRMIDDGWFSLGYITCGQLDVDGKLTHLSQLQKI